MNLLEEIGHNFKINSTVVNVGEAGELVARIVLTRARDCTLPLRWSTGLVSSSLPYTTVREFFNKLIGVEATRLSLEKINDPLLCEGYINFIQFVGISSPLSDKRQTDRLKDPLESSQLFQGFTRGAAFIAMPNQKSCDLFLPVLVLKASSRSKPKELRTINDYYITYIAISVKWRKTVKQSVNEKFWSPPIVSKKGSTIALADTAPIFILMDLGLRPGPITYTKQGKASQSRPDIFAINNEGRINDHVLAKMVTADISDQPLPVGHHSEPFLAILVRGMNSAYPCMKDVDPKDEFQIAVDTRRCEKGQFDMDEPKTTTIPFFFRGQSETWSQGIKPYEDYGSRKPERHSLGSKIYG